MNVVSTAHGNATLQRSHSAAGLQPRQALNINDVVLHHLRTPTQIHAITHLRDEIDLSVHAAAGREHFERLEKKETSAASSAASKWRASGSAPSASFRWASS